MMFCTNCGKHINDGAKFCEHCGASQAPKRAFCTNCGKEINRGVKFCEHCGAAQTTVPAIPAVPNPIVSCSKYSQLEQTNIVGMAASLAASIEVERSELRRIASESFRCQPENIEELPAWNRDLDSWQITKQAKLAFIQNDIKENMEALDVLYLTTKLIPNSYKSVNKLLWLYDDMSTSEHDIERAIDLYNHKETNDLLRIMNRNVDDLKSTLVVGFTAVYEAIQENTMIQTEILSNQINQQDMLQEIINNQNISLTQQSVMISQQAEMISGLGRIRKSARIGNFLSVGSLIQNHKRNKMLSDIHKSFT